MPLLCSLARSALARVQSLIPFAGVTNAQCVSSWASPTVLSRETQRCLISTITLAIKRAFPSGT